MSTVEPHDPPKLTEDELRECLPRAFVRKLAPVLPVGAQYRLILTLPGTRVRVPAKPDPGHPLASVLSMAQFAALCDFAKGQRIDIPVGRRLQAERLRRQIIALAAAGHSAGEIAKRTGRTTRWVRKVLSASESTVRKDSTPPEPRKPSLAVAPADHFLPVETESRYP